MMKIYARAFILICFFVFFIFGCNDGKLEIEQIKFSGETAYSCVNDTTTTFLYKTNNKQALILSFAASTLRNEEGLINGRIPDDFQLIFRDFDNSVTSNYFCSKLPVSSPKVISEIWAKGGGVSIETKKTGAGREEKFTHVIKITDLLIMNDKGEKLIDSSMNFGVFSTKRIEKE